MDVVVIGTGSIGRRHISNIQSQVPDARFLLVRENSRADEFSRSLNARIAGSVQDALALKPALAVVANPSSEHFETTVPLLRAQVPVYVEKPVVTTMAEADALAQLGRDIAFPPALAGCNFRFLPSLRRLKEIVAAGGIGRPVRAHLQVGQWLPGWRPAQDYRKSYSADPKRGGGAIFDLVHELDMARFLFGDLTFVAAAGGRFSRLEIESEDTAAILLTGARGPVVAVSVDYVARKPVRRYEIVGDEATIEWDLFAKTLVMRSQHEAAEIDVPGGFDVPATYRDAMAELIQAVKTNGKTSQDLAEGIASARLAIKARDMVWSANATLQPGP